MIPRCWQQILFSAIVIGPASWTLAKVPEFNANRAFSHLVRQCDFGPRNPGSSGHQACLEYLVETLSKCTESVQLQTFQQELPGLSLHLVAQSASREQGQCLLYPLGLIIKRRPRIVNLRNKETFISIGKHPPIRDDGGVR